MVLAIILATYLMIILDATIVITALPEIHRALQLLVRPGSPGSRTPTP